MGLGVLIMPDLSLVSLFLAVISVALSPNLTLVQNKTLRSQKKITWTLVRQPEVNELERRKKDSDSDISNTKPP